MDINNILSFAKQHYMIFVAIAVAIILVVVIDLLMTKSEKKKMKKYASVFEEAYNEDSDVIAALNKTKESFSAKSDQAKAIDTAVSYIQHSIMHDYKTAFYMIEDVIRGQQVQDVHDKVLMQEKDKKKSMLLLTAPADSSNND